MPEDPGLEWLLSCPEPAVRRLALLDLLNREESDPQVAAASAQLLEGEWVKALFANQEPDGGFGVHPYQKWMGAHWRLVSLVELGIPAGEPRALAAAEQVLHWLGSPEHLKRIQVIDGRTRRCASQEGNALAVCSRLGLANDPRVQSLAQSLIAWQWPDGGWNCDKRPEASHSSFYESLSPMWGLIEYHRATGDAQALAAARRTTELMLDHRLFRSHRTGERDSSFLVETALSALLAPGLLAAIIGALSPWAINGSSPGRGIRSAGKAKAGGWLLATGRVLLEAHRRPAALF